MAGATGATVADLSRADADAGRRRRPRCPPTSCRGRDGRRASRRRRGCRRRPRSTTGAEDAADAERRTEGAAVKVVLREDVEKLGQKGDLLEVADGYARNYLVPAWARDRRDEGRGRAGRGDAAQPPGRATRATRKPAQELATRLDRDADRGEGARRRGRQAVRLGHHGRHRRRGRRRRPGSSSTGARSTLDEPLKELGPAEVPVQLHPEVTVDARPSRSSPSRPVRAVRRASTGRAARSVGVRSPRVHRVDDRRRRLIPRPGDNEAGHPPANSQGNRGLHPYPHRPIDATHPAGVRSAGRRGERGPVDR